jgi:hypothetical protein
MLSTIARPTISKPQSKSFCDRDAVVQALRGKTVALVGSGPGVLGNPPGLVDSHDVVVRVNNYRLFPATGYRTDIYYSYFGGAIRKTAAELRRDGVKLCIAKCPNDQFMESDWHKRHGKMNGVDFRGIYAARAAWWFCPTYVPTVDEFMANFRLLGGHVPTTGFAALLDVLACEPRHVFLTGFDFFSSGIHNVTDRWKKANPDDPIGHSPAGERAWLEAHLGKYPITMDQALAAHMSTKRKGMA